MNQKGFANIILVVVIVVLVGAVGYFVFVKKSEPIAQQPSSTPATTQTKTPALTPTPKDETVNWKTHSDQQLGILIKYPEERWSLDINKESQTIFRGFGLTYKKSNPTGFPMAQISMIMYPPDKIYPGYVLPSFDKPINPGDKVEESKIEVSGYNASKYKRTDRDGFIHYAVVINRSDLSKHFVFQYGGISSQPTKDIFDEMELIIFTFKFIK